MSDISKRVDFSPARYATDSGPGCAWCSLPDGQALWLYLIERRQVVAQCACCHRVEWFDLTDRTPVDEPTIHDLKAEHYAARKPRKVGASVPSEPRIGEAV